MGFSKSQSDQDNYELQIKARNDDRLAQTGCRPSAFVKTFGCQMNAHDSEKIETMLTRMGYGAADSEADADLVLYNTCCVRENAENHVFGNLGLCTHYKERRRDMRVVVCGCMTQQDAVIEKIRRSYRVADVVFGALNLHRFPELLYENLTTGKQVIAIQKNADAQEPEVTARVRHFLYKASVNITYGCDNYCSYCIVPYVRGRQRSRLPDDILREIRELAGEGTLEICLLGQNVNSYSAGIGFPDLLEQICQIQGIERIRFMTSHPKDLSKELIRTMRSQPKICKHLHLPMQSGSSHILRLMNRRYTRDDYLRLAENLKTAMPELALTTDIIVGFPGETDEDFAETLDIVKQVRFAGAFTFLYSKREGTPAARMENQTPPEVSHERFQKLLGVVNPIVLEENQKFIGKTVRVLPEEINARNPELLTGRADNNAIVHLSADKDRLGILTNVRITGCKTFYLLGETDA